MVAAVFACCCQPTSDAQQHARLHRWIVAQLVLAGACFVVGNALVMVWLWGVPDERALVWYKKKHRKQNNAPSHLSPAPSTASLSGAVLLNALFSATVAALMMIKNNGAVRGVREALYQQVKYKERVVFFFFERFKRRERCGPLVWRLKAKKKSIPAPSTAMINVCSPATF